MDTTETYGISPPTPATLKQYGFGAGEEWVGVEDGPEKDWLTLLAFQFGKCGVCAKVPTPNATTGKVRLVIDHEHVRGWKKMAPAMRRRYVRGLVCWFCNHYYLGRGLTLEKARGVVAFLERYEARNDPDAGWNEWSSEEFNP